MPGLSQNRRFQEEMGGRELSSQSGSLPLKTGELEHMRSNFAIYVGIFTKNLKFGHVSLKTGDFEIKREDERKPLKTGVSVQNGGVGRYVQGSFMYFLGSVFHVPVVKHPHQRTIGKLRNYESLHKHSPFILINVSTYAR